MMVEIAECAVDRDIHTGVFNLDVIQSGSLPIFCHCGDVEFDIETDIDWHSPDRWISLVQHPE